LSIPAAVLLAIALHPLVMVLSKGIQLLYPIGTETERRLTELSAILQEAPLPALLLVLAVAPAICEELAFRGFILSGLRRLGRRRTAIVVSSIFFGVTHGVLQQSLSACAVGMVLGYLAVQTGSLIPCVLFHLTHNSLTVLSALAGAKLVGGRPWLDWLIQPTGDGEYIYTAPAVAIGGLATLLLLSWFRKLPSRPLPEERRQHALEHQAAGAVAR
jgi:sodium transport system permease protein